MPVKFGARPRSGSDAVAGGGVFVCSVAKLFACSPLNTWSWRVIDELLGTMWKDNVKAWSLRSDGSYSRLVAKDEEVVRSQQRFIDLTRERARESEAILGLSS